MKIDISTDLHPNTFVEVDECDLGLFENVKWTPDESGYAHRKLKGGRKLYLHRAIIGAGPNDIVDHKNRNRSDNRRENLRIVCASENVRNRAGIGASSFRGVHLKRQKWQATINALGQVWALGLYETEVEAAAAYDDALAFFELTGSGLNLPNRNPIPKEPKRRNIGPHGYPGVRKLPSGRYGVRVIAEGKRFSVGTFLTSQEAAQAARKALAQKQ